MATTNSTSGDSNTKMFKTFPEFSRLTFANKEVYEALIREYLPIADISFAILMLWWNSLDSLAVSLLNDNVVISYWLPGDEKRSGLSIVGTNKIDESLCTIFDYLQAKGDDARMVYVPEFVISHIEHPELFRFIGERSHDEYILSLNKYYPLRHAVSYRRHRVNKFLSKVDESQIAVKSLDLSLEENQQTLLECDAKWPTKGTINELVKISGEAMRNAIINADAVGMENVCLYIGNKPHAYILYQLPADKRYAIFSHAKINYDIPYTFDYMVYAFSRWFIDQGISLINIDCDLGLPMLRMIKLALGPTNYFRKYTITPAG